MEEPRSDITPKIEPRPDNTPKLEPELDMDTPVKREIPERPSSPETNCAICLEEISDKCYTDTCLHKFCFKCLTEWSKIKPECPLCKQRFTSIMTDNLAGVERFEVRQVQAAPPHSHLESTGTVLINLAFQRPRFSYRTTMGGRAMVFIENLHAANRGVNVVTSRHMIQDWRRRRELGTSEFRRNIYRQGLWVRRSSDPRVRESSPEFYRLNSAQTHRLVPWLNRELNVLLDLSLDSHAIAQEILNLISLYHITSSYFNRAMVCYLSTRTPHFVHEFYNFAISPYDMLAYDLHAEYSSVSNFTDVTPNTESDSDIEVVHTRLVPEPLVNIDLSTMMAGPSGLHTAPPPEAILIDISDDDSVVFNSGQGSDSDSVQIVGSLPPRNLRTPEIITLDTDTDDGAEVVVTEEETVPSVSEEPSYETDSVEGSRCKKRRRAATTAAALVKYEMSSSEDSSEKKPKRKRRPTKGKWSKKSKSKKADSRRSKYVTSTTDSSADEDEESPPRKGKKSSKKKSRSKARPRLRSVVRLVKNPGEGHSSWTCENPVDAVDSSSESSAGQHRVRQSTRSQKVLYYGHSYSDTSDDDRTF